MLMGLYKVLSSLWRKNRKELERSRYVQWRREGAVVRIERPTRLDRARRLGYKAKQGVVLVRVRVRKGARRKERPNKGRRPKRMGVSKITPAKSWQLIAEERAQRKFPNLEVLGSYKVGDDSVYQWYEVIFLDPFHPAVKNDKEFRWIAEKQHKKRVHRGLTSAGKKVRGLRK